MTAPAEMSEPRAEAALGPVEQMISTTIATALGLGSAMRRGKVVHPHGAVHEATLRVSDSADAPQARLFTEVNEHRAIVRFSRSIGWPHPMPDLLGMALRVLGAYGTGRHQDLMLISSVDLPVLHHLFIPVRDVWSAPYTSSLPYRAGDDRFLIGALPRLTGPQPAGRSELDRLNVAADADQLRFSLAVATITGRFRPVGAELHVGRRLPAELDATRFNPWNTGEDLQPAGWLQAARGQSYRRSQSGWRLTQRRGAERQDGADAAFARAAHEHRR